MNSRDDTGVRSRRAAMLIAGSGLFWALFELIGAEYGWSPRLRALISLIAGAGFVYALWMIYQIWRARQNNQG